MCIDNALRDVQAEGALQGCCLNLAAEQGIADAADFITVQILPVIGDNDFHKPVTVGACCHMNGGAMGISACRFDQVGDGKADKRDIDIGFQPFGPCIQA